MRPMFEFENSTLARDIWKSGLEAPLLYQCFEFSLLICIMLPLKKEWPLIFEALEMFIKKLSLLELMKLLSTSEQ